MRAPNPIADTLTEFEMAPPVAVETKTLPPFTWPESVPKPAWYGITTTLDGPLPPTQTTTSTVGTVYASPSPALPRSLTQDTSVPPIAQISPSSSFVPLATQSVGTSSFVPNATQPVGTSYTQPVETSYTQPVGASYDRPVAVGTSYSAPTPILQSPRSQTMPVAATPSFASSEAVMQVTGMSASAPSTKNVARQHPHTTMSSQAPPGSPRHAPHVVNPPVGAVFSSPPVSPRASLRAPSPPQFQSPAQGIVFPGFMSPAPPASPRPVSPASSRRTSCYSAPGLAHPSGPRQPSCYSSPGPPSGPPLLVAPSPPNPGGKMPRQPSPPPALQTFSSFSSQKGRRPSPPPQASMPPTPGQRMPRSPSSSLVVPVNSMAREKPTGSVPTSKSLEASKAPRIGTSYGSRSNLPTPASSFYKSFDSKDLQEDLMRLRDMR